MAMNTRIVRHGLGFFLRNHGLGVPGGVVKTARVRHLDTALPERRRRRRRRMRRRKRRRRRKRSACEQMVNRQWLSICAIL